MLAPRAADSATPRIVVRAALGVEELRACQDLQRRTWGITEDGYVVPVATMVAAQKVGGLVLVAVEPGHSGREHVVGFCFGFLGRLDGDLVLYSQVTAVDPARQGQGIGRMLKMAQHAAAAADGLGAVVWTFDPLQAANAAFNLGALGATVRRYEVDLFGSRNDALNAGLATDRVFAHWSTRHSAVPGRRERWPDASDAIQLDGGGWPTPRPDWSRQRLHLPVPGHVNGLRAGALDHARAWQTALRSVLPAAFERGYVAVGFAPANETGDAAALPCYLLERP